MLTNRIRAAAAAFAVALAAATAAAQQPTPRQSPQQQREQEQSQPQPARPSPAPDYVDHKDFQAMLFPVRYRDPETLVPVLRLLTSGYKGSGVTADRNFRVITVRDFAENVASISDAIKRLDTPDGPRPDVELRMHVLLASESAAAAGAEQPPADLREVLTQLQSTLNFKSYELLTSVVQRTKESRVREPGYIEGKGTAQATGAGGEKQTFNYNFGASSLSLTPGTAAGSTVVQLGGFSFNIGGNGVGAHIRSDLSLREGERVVVGTAGMGNRALILVMTARTIK
jgi:hypothetical protein